MKVLERKLGIGVETLDRELACLAIPASAVPVVSVAPVVAEFERVTAAAGISIKEVRVADVCNRGGTVLAHAGTGLATTGGASLPGLTPAAPAAPRRSGRSGRRILGALVT